MTYSYAPILRQNGGGYLELQFEPTTFDIEPDVPPAEGEESYENKVAGWSADNPWVYIIKKPLLSEDS